MGPYFLGSCSRIVAIVHLARDLKRYIWRLLPQSSFLGPGYPRGCFFLSIYYTFSWGRTYWVPGLPGIFPGIQNITIQYYIPYHTLNCFEEQRWWVYVPKKWKLAKRGETARLALPFGAARRSRGPTVFLHGFSWIEDPKTIHKLDIVDGKTMENQCFGTLEYPYFRTTPIMVDDFVVWLVMLSCCTIVEVIYQRHWSDISLSPPK